MGHREPHSAPEEKERRRRNSAAARDAVRSATSLHLSQKVFWFCASACLSLGTIVFCIQVVRGREAAVKFLGVEITSAKAEASIITARERLLAIRTKLDDAAEINDTAAIDRILPEFDDVLKALGVAEAAIKRRATFGATDYYEYVPNDGMHDDEGNYWGGYGYASPTPSVSPKPTPKK